MKMITKEQILQAIRKRLERDPWPWVLPNIYNTLAGYPCVTIQDNGQMTCEELDAPKFITTGKDPT